MAIEARPGWRPDWAVPPGEILLEALQERDMTQAELARRMDRPLKTINEIVKAKAALTAETAIQLEHALGIAARFWNSLEANYRDALAREEERRSMEREASWIDHFPLRELKRYGLLRKGGQRAQVLGDLLNFFRVSSPSAWEKHWLEPVASYRGSSALRWSPYAVAAWLRWGEIEGARIDCKPFDPGRFRRVLKDIRVLTAEQPSRHVLNEVQRLCAQCGVAVVASPELPGAPLSGAARWIRSDRALIQLSLRHKSDDQFWFSFFHEAGHLLESATRRDFIDLADGAADQQAEDKADKFARDLLIPPSDYQRLLSLELTAASVRQFAKDLRISPGIVVGRLHRDDVLKPSQLRGLKRRMAWASPSR